MAEPKCKKFRIDTLEPRRANPNRDKVEPNLPKDLTDSDEPMVTRS